MVWFSRHRGPSAVRLVYADTAAIAGIVSAIFHVPWSPAVIGMLGAVWFVLALREYFFE